MGRPQYHSDKPIKSKKILNVFCIFLFGLCQPKSFVHEPETELIQFGFKKMDQTLPEMLIQTNPTIIVRVGLVRVVGLNVHPYDIA